MAQGNQKQFYEQLVSKHSTELYRFAFRFCGDSDMADDIVAETFTTAWRRLSSLRQKDKARAWLYGIMRNNCSSWLRDRTRQASAPLPDEMSGSDPVVDGDILESFALQDHLQAALDRVDVRFREPFLMVFLTGFSCQETADALDIPLGTVLSRVHRARKALRREIKLLSQAPPGQGGAYSETDQLRVVGGKA